MLQAVGRRSGVDLKTQASIVYGAPPLLSQKALQRENDATLTFWNFCAELEGKGFKRAIDMEDNAQAARRRRAGRHGGLCVRRRLGGQEQGRGGKVLRRCRQGQGYLGRIGSQWQRLAPRIGVSDKAGLEIYRQRYREGIPRRSIRDEENDAKALYRVLAELGGTELVGPARELDKGTY